MACSRLTLFTLSQTSKCFKEDSGIFPCVLFVQQQNTLCWHFQLSWILSIKSSQSFIRVTTEEEVALTRQPVTAASRMRSRVGQKRETWHYRWMWHVLQRQTGERGRDGPQSCRGHGFKACFTDPCAYGTYRMAARRQHEEHASCWFPLPTVQNELYSAT